MLKYYLVNNSIFTSGSNGDSISTGHLLGPFLQKSKNIRLHGRHFWHCLIFICSVQWNLDITKCQGTSQCLRFAITSFRGIEVLFPYIIRYSEDSVMWRFVKSRFHCIWNFLNVLFVLFFPVKSLAQFDLQCNKFFHSMKCHHGNQTGNRKWKQL